MSEKRLRFLHKNYSRTGQWGWRIARRIRSFGWALALLTTIAAVLGTNIEESGIYMIFCFTICALTCAFLWVLFRRAKVSAQRHLPEYGSVGHELQYNVEVTNENSKTLNAMFFEEWPPDPAPDYETFASTPEPGEEKRNIVDRTMLFYRWTWLQERERGFSLLEASQSPRKLASKEKGKATFRLTPQHRGVLHLAELRVLLPDPFGMFQRCIPIDCTVDHIIVLPKRYPLADFSLPGSAHLHLGGEAASSSIGQTGDFLHLRDYQSGDPIRSVDWKSWARTGIPVVREYEDNFFPHYGVILDTSGPPGDNFEEAVAIAASFVSRMDTQECLLDLMFIGEESYRITAGQGVAKRSKLLEALANVHPRHRDNFDSLEALILKEGTQLTALLLIFPDWTEERHQFLKNLRAHGLEITVFAVVDETTKKTLSQLPVANLHPIELGRIGPDLSLAAARLSL